MTEERAVSVASPILAVVTALSARSAVEIIPSVISSLDSGLRAGSGPV
jgi:hypothetical protein